MNMFEVLTIFLDSKFETYTWVNSLNFFYLQWCRNYARKTEEKRTGSVRKAK